MGGALSRGKGVREKRQNERGSVRRAAGTGPRNWHSRPQGPDGLRGRGPLNAGGTEPPLGRECRARCAQVGLGGRGAELRKVPQVLRSPGEQDPEADATGGALPGPALIPFHCSGS